MVLNKRPPTATGWPAASPASESRFKVSKNVVEEVCAVIWVMLVGVTVVNRTGKSVMVNVDVP